MANRLNVLIGATLAKDVEGNLNNELRKLSGKLQAIEIKANFDGDFKKLQNALTIAFKDIDFSGLTTGVNNAAKQVEKTTTKMTKNIKDGIIEITKITKQLNTDKIIGETRTTKDLNSGIEKSIIKKLDKDGKWVEHEYTTNNSEQKIYQQYKKTVKQAEDTRDKVKKIYEDISDSFAAAFGEKKGQGIFYEPELNAELQKIDDITKRLKTQELSFEEMIDLQSELNSLLSKAEKFKKTSGYESEDIKKQIKAEEKAAKEREKLQLKRYQRDLKFNSKAAENKEKEELKAYQKVLKLRSQAEADKFKGMLGQKGSLSRNIDKEIKNVKDKFSKISDAWAKTHGKTDGTEFIDTKKLDSYLIRLSKAKETLKETVVSQEDLNKATKELQSIQNGMKKYESEMSNKLSVEKNTKALRDKWNTEKAKLESEMKNNVVNMGFKFGDSFDTSKLKEMYNINERIEKILLREDATWEQISKEIAEVRGNVRLYNSELDTSQKKMKEQKEALEKMTSMSDFMNSSMGRFSEFYIFGEAARGLKTAATSIVSEIKTIDDAMVELKKVSDETDYTYEKFLDGAADKAKQLGVSMSDYVDSVTNFKRMGVSDFGDAQIVAQNANIMQTVAESLTADQASEYLISIMSSFNYEASETMDIIDKLNNISNNFSITTDGLAEALKRGGATLREGNNDLSESIALITTANKVIQDPKTVGNAMKTISIDKLVA